MTKKLSTNDIFAKIEKGEPVDVKEVEFVSPDTMRDKLYAKITEMPPALIILQICVVFILPIFMNF